jgi:hypothetical protein
MVTSSLSLEANRPDARLRADALRRPDERPVQRDVDSVQGTDDAASCVVLRRPPMHMHPRPVRQKRTATNRTPAQVRNAINAKTHQPPPSSAAHIV